MIHYNFHYSLPYGNHRNGRPDIMYYIEDYMDNHGFVVCKFPQDEMIVNPHRAYMEIYELAKQELMQKRMRIAMGEVILSELFDEPGKPEELPLPLSTQIAVILLVIILIFLKS